MDTAHTRSNGRARVWGGNIRESLDAGLREGVFEAGVKENFTYWQLWKLWSSPKMALSRLRKNEMTWRGACSPVTILKWVIERDLEPRNAL